MRSKSPSIIFPAIEGNVYSEVVFTKQEIQNLCCLSSAVDLVRLMAAYVTEKYRTKQMQKQYDAMQDAVDAQYTELENQARIHFQELQKKLEIEYEKKVKLLEDVRIKAERESDIAYIERQISFNEFVRTSNAYKKIFEELRQSAGIIYEIISFAEEEKIANNTKYYVKLCEQYRELLRGIEKYSKLIV